MRVHMNLKPRDIYLDCYLEILHLVNLNSEKEIMEYVDKLRKMYGISKTKEESRLDELLDGVR